MLAPVSETSRVRIASCRDHAEAALIESVLRGHGLHVFVNGQHGAPMFGLAAHLALDVWVDSDEAEEALALIRELREGGEGGLRDDEQPVDDVGEPVEDAGAERRATDDDDHGDAHALAVTGDDTLARLGRRTRMLLAVALGLFIGHGTAHMSARAWKRGFVLAGVQVFGWRTLLTGNVRGGAAIVVATIAMDIIGALVHLSQTLPAEPPLPRAQLRKRR